MFLRDSGIAHRFGRVASEGSYYLADFYDIGVVVRNEGSF